MNLRAALFVLPLLAVACGGGGHVPQVRITHVVVSFVPAGAPEDRTIRDYSAKRTAPIIRGASVSGDRESILSEVRRTNPEFVTVFVPADALDTNFALAFQDLAAAVDSDIFTDFTYGFVPVVDLPLIQRWFQAIKIAEHRPETSLYRATTVDLGTTPEHSLERLEWASGLPRKNIKLLVGDRAGLKEQIKDIEDADFLLVVGSGSPKGHSGGLTVADVEGLKVDNQVVFLGTTGTAVVGPYLSNADGTAKRTKLAPKDCLALAFLRQGATTILGPLDEDTPISARAEMDLAILSNASVGHIMKNTYDCARIVRTLRDEPLPLRIDGKPIPTEYGRAPKVLHALSRVLLGDPSLQPFTRATQSPLKFDGTFEKMGPNNQPLMVLRYVVAFPEAKFIFTDPIGDGDRMHIRHELPAGTKEAYADLVGTELDGEQVTARLQGQAIETWEGKLYLHAIIGGEAGKLSRRGLKVTLNVRRN